MALICDYCSKPSSEVERMISGENHAAICSECIATSFEAYIRADKEPKLQLREGDRYV